MPPRALPSSKPKTAAEKWKAWLASEYKDEQKFSANLVRERIFLSNTDHGRLCKPKLSGDHHQAEQLCCCFAGSCKSSRPICSLHGCDHTVWRRIRHLSGLSFVISVLQQGNRTAT